MPFLLERNVSVIVRESNSEYDDENNRIRRAEFGSVKKSKDGDNVPPRLMLSRVERSVFGSRESFHLPDSIVIPLNNP